MINSLHYIDNTLSEAWRELTKPLCHKRFYMGLLMFFILSLVEKYVCSLYINASMFVHIEKYKITFSSFSVLLYLGTALLGAWFLTKCLQKQKSITSIFHADISKNWTFTLMSTFAILILPQLVDNSESTNQKWLFKLIESDPITTTAIVIAGVIIAPAIEEITDRGIFFNLFDMNHLNWLSCTILVIIESAWFAHGHMTDSFSQFLSYAVAGAVLCVCYLHTKSLMCSYIVHASTNALGFILMFMAISK